MEGYTWSMKSGKGDPDPKDIARALERIHRDKRERADSYREQALKLFPHMCRRCGREFAGKELRELTVHHKDNNHMNNPPDGSNWALLCLYCHDDEHGTLEQRGLSRESPKGIRTQPSLGFNAFEGLKDLLPPQPSEEEK